MDQDFKMWWHEHVRLRRFAVKRWLSGKFVCPWKGHDMSERLYSIEWWGAEGRGRREEVYATCSRCGNRGELLEVLPLPGNTRNVSEDPFIVTAERQRQAQEIAEHIREGLNRGEFTWGDWDGGHGHSSSGHNKTEPHHTWTTEKDEEGE